MMKTAFLYAGMIAFAALLALAPAGAATAAQAVIAEVQAALDKGDAQQAASLAGSALQEDGVGQGERAGLLLYRGLAHELKGAHEDALADFTADFDKIVYFLNRLSFCVDGGLCSRKMADAYFRDYAASFWAYFAGYIDKQRKAGTPTYALAIEKYVSEGPPSTSPEN